MATPPALKRYKEKRDFRKTPEPTGGKPSSGKDLSFVIQKHAASHLHYDFRLEWDGVLKSWAVPKGPSTDPQVKRLAMQVEDHPLDYKGFEGVIPKGEYGGGNVIVWDRGRYRNLSTRDGRPITIDQALEKGHVQIWLEGEKLRGGYTLIRTHSNRYGSPGGAGSFHSGKQPWLLIKLKDAEAHRPANPVETMPQSVISGRKVEEMNSGDRVWHSNRPSKKTAVPSPQPSPLRGARGFTPGSSKTFKKNPLAPSGGEGGGEGPHTKPSTGLIPMLATLVDEPFNRPGWIYETKLDGVRCIAFRQGKDVGLFARSQKIITDTYPELVSALKKQRSNSFIVDGEVVAFEPGTKKSSFHRLQRRMHLTNAEEVKRTPVKVFYYLFDILYAGGKDVRRLPLKERKTLLKRTIRFTGPIQLNVSTDRDGEAYFREACRKGLEGIIAKRADSTYQAGRSRDWLKFKCLNEQEFVIGGYSDPQGTRESLGALLLGYHDGGQLRFAGKVGTGFDTATLRLLKDKFRPLERKTSPFGSIDLPLRGLHWVEPRLVAQIAFGDWTPDGKLRHPRYIGLRDDKLPREVTRETKAPSESVAKTPADPPAPQPLKQMPKQKEVPNELRIGDRVVALSNVHKVFYPSTGFTKGQVLNYYIQIAPQMLPYLKGRPLTMKRYPDGVDGMFFYEKQAPRYRPAWMKTFTIKDVKTTEYPVVDDLAALVWIANLACLEFHTLLARVPKVDSPTMIAFDFDPGPPLDILACGRVAFKLREVLEDLKLKSFLKTSGGKGLHLYIPLNTPVTYDQTKAFAHSIALMMEKKHPQEIVSNMSKALRQGKVLIDWSQNSSHKTTVTAYSLRARPTPSVSTPITWDELKTALTKKDPARLRFTPDDVLKRVAKNGDLFAPVLTLKQKLPSFKLQI